MKANEKGYLYEIYNRFNGTFFFLELIMKGEQPVYINISGDDG